MRRVVVTGMGMVTGLGVGVDRNWKRITNSESGISKISVFDASDIAAQIAGQVPRTTEEELLRGLEGMPPAQSPGSQRNGY